MKLCVYTALFGDYESLNEQPLASQSRIPFICITDNREVSSDSWQIRQVSPTFSMDSVRSQREYKLQPHKYLPEYSHSVYIDNSIILKVDPEEIIEKLFPKTGFLIFEHSFRESVLDEFLEVSRLGLDDQSKIFEQLNHYFVDYPEVLLEKPYWGGFQLRDHRNQSVCKMLDIWYAHVLRYSRRDQLSVNLAFKLANLKPDVIRDINEISWFHEWGKFTNRNRNKSHIDPFLSLLPSIGRLKQQEMEMANKDRLIIEKDRTIDGLLNSVSWKITAPLRQLYSKITWKKK